MASGVNPARIALVGCGRWGQHILRDLVELGCNVSVVDAEASAREHAIGHGAQRVSAALEGLGPLDGIVIATPAATHAGMVEAALEFDVPLFCEKPLALRADEAASVAARAHGRLFMMDKWRYHPGVEALRDLARSGEIGTVVGLRTTRIGWSPAQVDSDPVWTLLPHDLSIALEILGFVPEPRLAVAELVARRPVGLSAVLGEQPWFIVEAGGASPVERREIRLTCSEAVAVLPDAYSDHLRLLSPDPRAGVAPVRGTRSIAVEPPLLRELRAFLAYLGGGAPPRSSVSDGLRVASLVLRLRQMAGIDEAAFGASGDGTGAAH